MTCPYWHLYPGPYDGDEDKTECPNRDSHAQQRAEREYTGPSIPREESP